jgi:hypothetical protein
MGGGIGATLAGMGLAVLSGCGSFTGSGIAESEVLLVGDIPAADGGATQEHPYEGTVTATLRVFLLGSTGFPISITGGARDVTVDLQGDAPATVGEFTLSPGVYQGVRVSFLGVRADLTSGLGAGPPLEGGWVTVDLGSAGALVLDRATPLLIADDGRLEVTVNLRAPVWIGAVAGAPGPDRVVPGAVFGGAVQLITRVE